MKNKQTEKFTIVVRVRPRLKQDSLTYREADLEQILESDTSTVTIKRKNNEEKLFRFNHVFNPGAQKELYERSAHLVESIFEGYNATFLAYGQTGTGKTHTIFGSDSVDQGYFYLSVEDVFNTIKRRLNERQFAVRVSFVEFYMDNIYDLLESSNRKLEIKQNSEDGVHIKDLTEVSVRSADDLFSCMRKAVKMRKTEETSANKRSSRSHAVIQVTVLQRWNEGGETKYLKGMLKIVDLAGSQRVSKTESNGNRLEQAKRINKQITTLGKCINLLAQAQKQNRALSSEGNRFNFNKSHIPFRDSKITRYLSEALEGKAKIILCVCISKLAMAIEESFSSLMFATQASTLKVDSIRNEVFTMATIKKSVEKPNTSYQTPLRAKTEIKKDERHPQRDNSTNRSFHDQSGVLGKPTAGSEHTRTIAGEKLVQKFKRELQQINEFMSKREVNIKGQSKQILEQNLQAMHKIFSIMRENNLPSFY